MNNIILIGFMGSGKTSIGKKLSDWKHCDFIDTDCLIEQSQKKRISDIFQIDGEETFREMETHCLINLLDHSINHTYIISTGGGLPIRQVNQDILKQLGYIIYLRAKPETIYNRLKYDNTRPLLQEADPQKKIDSLMRERDPIYESVSNFIIDVDTKTIEDISMEIMEKNI